jgi:YbbR domain-containing protein
MKKIKEMILNDFGLKVFSLLSAMVLWFLVTSFNDPITTMQVMNVTVKLQHTNLITDRNEVFSVEDDSDVIPVVTITAPRSIVDNLKADNVIATADVANMQEDGSIPITLTTNIYSREIASIRGSTEFVRLRIEDSSTKTLTLGVDTIGQPAAGYVLGSVSPEQNQIRISGARSLVSSVDQARVTVDITDARDNISTYVEVLLYDNEGETVASTHLSMNLYSVKVNAEILPTAEVPITWAVRGEPAEGCELTGEASVAPETVLVAAPERVLKKVDAIEIPAGQLNITGLTSDLTKTVNIADFLPDGVWLADSSFDGRVTVFIGIRKTAEDTEEEEY